MRHQTRLVFALTGVLSVVFSLSGCSSAPKPEERPMLFPASTAPIPAKKLWTRRIPGLLTDLNLSHDGTTILVAIVPDRDSLDASANRSQYLAVFYSTSGKILSQTEMPAQIKSQSLSADGSLGVIATYDDMIRGYDRSGMRLWEAEAFCKPIVLSSLKRVLCFHDDDAQPDVGFELFDFKGKKVSEFPIKYDALMLKVAPDEKSFIMALTHGKVIVFDSHFKPIAKKSVAGEVVDVAISASNGGQPTFAVLYNKKKSASQKLAIFGKKNTDWPVSDRADQIEISPTGAPVIGYANTGEGQILLRYGEKAPDFWKRTEKISSEYSSQIVVTSDVIWTGFQDTETGNAQHSHVLGFDFAGGLDTDIEVPSEEGAFLYTYSVAPAVHKVAVGSDDGRLSLFRVSEGE